MNMSYVDPRRITRESIWFAGGAALVTAASLLAPTAMVGFLAAIVPTVAILGAASRSLLPALLMMLVSAALAFTIGELVFETFLFGVALLLIFVGQRVVERMDARAAVPRPGHT